MLIMYITYYKIDGFQVSSNFSSLDLRYIFYNKREAIKDYRERTGTKYKHITIKERYMY